MVYQLPSLQYDYNALEPYIDAQTMEIHHTKHHGTYVTKLNSVLSGYPDLAGMSLEAVLSDIRVVPEEVRQAVRNNGGGHLNHALFWQIMAPAGKGGKAGGQLLDAIEASFGDLTKMREELTSQALNRFGSGWAWLCLDDKGGLEIASTPNQDSPLMLGLKPLLGVDVWEHAYYLKYQNRRADYLNAWWNVVNWQRVAELYAQRIEAVARSRQSG